MHSPILPLSRAPCAAFTLPFLYVCAPCLNAPSNHLLSLHLKPLLSACCPRYSQSLVIVKCSSPSLYVLHSTQQWQRCSPYTYSAFLPTYPPLLLFHVPNCNCGSNITILNSLVLVASQHTMTHRWDHVLNDFISRDDCVSYSYRVFSNAQQ